MKGKEREHERQRQSVQYYTVVNEGQRDVGVLPSVALAVNVLEEARQEQRFLHWIAWRVQIATIRKVNENVKR
jgi:hypothetical protein